MYHRRINYPSFSPCRLRHPIFSISRFACYSFSFRIKSYQWSMSLWFYSSFHPSSLIFLPAKSFYRSNFWRNLEKSPPSPPPNLFLNAVIEFTEELPELESIPPMKIPVLYGQKGQRRRSFRLANYPWQSMNVKRIIRDRVYTEPPCFLP